MTHQHKHRHHSDVPARGTAFIADWSALTSDGRSVPDRGAFAETLRSLHIEPAQVTIVASAAAVADARIWASPRFHVVLGSPNDVFSRVERAARPGRRLFISASARGRLAEVAYQLKKRKIALGVLTADAVGPAVRAMAASITFLTGLYPLPPRIDPPDPACPQSV